MHSLQELRRSASLATKVFVQRDYSDGTTCQFQTKFPPELESRVGSLAGRQGRRCSMSVSCGGSAGRGVGSHGAPIGYCIALGQPMLLGDAITATLPGVQGLGCSWGPGGSGEGLQAQQILAWAGSGQGPGS